MADTIDKIKHSSFVNIVIRGFIILIPLIGSVVLINELYQLIESQIQKIMDTFHFSSRLHLFATVILGLILLLIIAYLVGRISKTQFVINLSSRINDVLMDTSESYKKWKLKVDNYAIFLLENKPPVFVRFGDSERPGFLMEEANSEGKCVVFIPKDFTEYNGNIYIVLASNVRKAKVDSNTMLKSLDHLGEGLDFS